MRKKIKNLGKRILAAGLMVCLLWTANSSTAQAVSQGNSISKGIDVSKHNGGVDWAQVAASGIQFTFIKVGSTKSGIDPNFAANITGAQAAGLKTGVYIYSYATTPEAAVNEANLVLEWINGYTVNFPVVFDFEDRSQRSLSSQQCIEIINAFCMTIDAAGYYPMVYSFKNMFDSKLGICGWDRWVAQYNDYCGHNNNVCFWQYSSKGRIGGIGGNVDLNYQYKNYDELIIPEGFIEHNGNTRFYSNWRMQRGWVAYNDTRYFLDEAGNMVRGWYADEAGAVYYLTPADGSIARGQAQIDGADFYFNENGVKTVGWVLLENGKFYYDPANNGIMKREWFSDEKGNVYFFDRADGHALCGAQMIDSTEFLFTAEGVRQVGWAALPEGMFYYDPASGAKVRGFMEDEKGRHYLSPDDGHMVTGEVVIDKQNYCFNAEGCMLTGRMAKEDGFSYYYDPGSGQMVHGFYEADNQTYYADEAGRIVTGVCTINKQPYYFDETGALVRNQPVVIEGKNYVTTPDGILTEVEEEAS